MFQRLMERIANKLTVFFIVLCVLAMLLVPFVVLTAIGQM